MMVGARRRRAAELWLGEREAMRDERGERW